MQDDKLGKLSERIDMMKELATKAKLCMKEMTK
jgi:hypothetical protein